MINRAIILASGPLQAGIAASLTQFVYRYNGDILDYDQYIDTEAEPKQFFARLEFSLDNFKIDTDQIDKQLDQDVRINYDMNLELELITRPKRVAIFVTKQLPCFYGVVLKTITKEWNAEPVMVVSNRETMADDANRFDIPFHHIPITKETKERQSAKTLALLNEHEIDLVVLAKYMQIIPANIVNAYENKIINIHHSMLPAFMGAKPYHQARDYGVKFIGATAHYVTEGLDEGPIISQNVRPISHNHTSNELVEMGQSIESEVLAKAVGLHLEHRVVLSGRRSVLFE